MVLSTLQKLWDDFSDVSINENDEIEQDFHLWEKGTDRFDIWHWFDEKTPNGLAAWKEETFKSQKD